MSKERLVTDPTPHQRIMRAAKANRGIRLTADEVQDLARDEAIAQAARNDDENDERIAEFTTK